MGSESGGDPADLVGDRCKQKGFPGSKPSSCFPMSAAPVLEGRHFSPKRMNPLWPWKESLYQWKEKMCWEESKGYLWDSGAVSRKDLCKKPPWGVTQVWAGAIGYCELWSTQSITCPELCQGSGLGMWGGQELRSAGTSAPVTGSCWILPSQRSSRRGDIPRSFRPLHCPRPVWPLIF